MVKRHNNEPVHISVLIDRFFPELKEETEPDYVQLEQLRLPYITPQKDSESTEVIHESTEQSIHTIDRSY